MAVKLKKRIFRIPDKNALLNQEVLVTVREAAEILRCHRNQIYEYIQAEYLTPHCPNGPGTKPMLIRTDSLRQFVNNFSVGGPFSIIKKKNS